MNRVLEESPFITDKLYLLELGNFTVRVEYHSLIYRYKYNRLGLADLTINNNKYHLMIYITSTSQGYANNILNLINKDHVDAIREFISLYHIPDYGFCISYFMVDHPFWNIVESFKPFNIIQRHSQINVIGDIYNMPITQVLSVDGKTIAKTNNTSDSMMNPYPFQNAPELKADFIIAIDAILYKVGNEYEVQPFSGDPAYELISLIKLMAKPIMVKSARK